MVRVLVPVAAIFASACSLIFPTKQPAPPPPAPETRADIELRLRTELEVVKGDACVKAEWLTKAAGRRGLEGEVAEELKAESTFACNREKSPRLATKTRPADEPAVEITFDGTCTRKDIEAKLQAAGVKKVDDAAIDDAFARCFATRIKECQIALDAEVEEGVACWRKIAWPEVPKSIDPAEIDNTSMCLGELKAVVADLRTCRTKKPAERDACVAPYLDYVPKCALIDPNRAWNTFPGREDIERVANADAKRRADREEKVAKEKAEREARVAKETERCFGRTTLEFAERLRASPGARNVPGCQYAVTGNVVSRNNVFVQLADSTGGLIVLLRTREVFPEGAPIADRVATFDSFEQTEMEDGTTRPYPVFKLSKK